MRLFLSGNRFGFAPLEWLFVSLPAVFAYGFFSTNDFLLFARLRCYLAVYLSGFAIEKFDQYHVYFRNDSVVQLAQAGLYEGANNIEEYVKFGFADYSPFLTMEDPNNPKPKISFETYKDGQCQFIALYKKGAYMDPANTRAALRFEYVTMVKLFYDFRSRYFSRANVYFTNDFLRLFFDDLLNSDPTRKYVCEQVMAGPCQSQLNITNATACEETLKRLPTLEGSNNHFDGYSQGCRSLHAFLASTNPTLHCAHLSFTPLVDPNGKIKCQTSLFVPPTDLFSEADIQALRNHAQKYNIDPDLGHNCCSNV
jgi:hypothetical protein